MASDPDGDRPLKIMHVIRAPVGGAFRHVMDLAHEQVERGHLVGIICDRSTGGERADAALRALAPRLALGMTRFAIPREPGPMDSIALARVARQIGDAAPDVVHGHGAKGGALARLTSAAPDAVRVYTPHGGSLHYASNSLTGIIYAWLERMLARRTDLFLFESEFARSRFATMVGSVGGLVRVIPNGVSAGEFEPVQPNANPADLVFLGELRAIKGPDVLIDAVYTLSMAGRPLRLVIGGEGDARDALQDQVERLGLDTQVRFAGYQPARTAFAMADILVVPSRAESLPYTVIEAAAAGVPIIASRVGGIPEIMGPFASRLVTPDDPQALAAAIADALDHRARVAAEAQALRNHVHKHFSVTSMAEGVLSAYAAARLWRREKLTAGTNSLLNLNH